MKKQGSRQVHDVADTDETTNNEPVACISTVHCISSDSSASRFPSKIYANVRFNDRENKVKLKIDTGSDACLLTEEDFRKSGPKGQSRFAKVRVYSTTMAEVPSSTSEL